ncbi:MAG: right-handed parallel beta-helix repeat-containing protein [Candidatus Latescibacteria bacterium]|nr:right-handed parallel beta-helix repeat-containing protein [Candidatus Latescibacterota bacterium]
MVTATGHAFPSTLENVTIRHQPGANGSNQMGVRLADASIVMRDCVVRDCVNAYFEAAGITAAGKCALVLENVEIRDTIGGGGLRLQSGSTGKPTVQATNCVFRNNRHNATEDIWAGGSGVRMVYTGYPLTGADASSTFDGCTFEGNTAWSFWGVDGSGVDIRDSGRTVSFYNCKFVDNTYETPAGAAVLVQNSLARLENCTIAGNRTSEYNDDDAPGGILAYGDNNTTTIRDCVIAFNDGLAFAEYGLNNTHTLSNSIFFGHEADDEWVSAGVNILSMDPAFCDAASSNYHLYAFSPAAEGPYYSERIGALDVGCVPPATVDVTPSGVAVGCPAGHAELNVTVSLDLDETVMTRTVNAWELLLDTDDFVATVFDANGFLPAGSDASAPNFTTTLSHNAFGGRWPACSNGDAVDVLLNGYPLAPQAVVTIRSPDLTGNGSVDLGDFAAFSQNYPLEPAPGDCRDFNGDAKVNLLDFTIYSQHNGHASPYDPANAPADVAQSAASVALYFTEEYPTATTHRLFVDVDVENFADVTTSLFAVVAGSSRLTFVEWQLPQSTLGTVMCAPVTRDGTEQLYFGVRVSESFAGSSSRLGRLVFDVTGTDPFEPAEDDFVLTYGEVLVESSSASSVTAQMTGVFQRALNTTVARIFHNRLEQNFPNPFNPTTTLAFSLKQAENVALTIYDVGGRRVRELVNERRERGAYKVVWDGQNDAGQTVASGVYFYKMVAGSFTDTKKMTILK